MHNTVYKWPEPSHLYPDRGKKSYRLKRFRYRFRSILHRSLIKKFEHKINSESSLKPLLIKRADYSYPLVHRFLDKRFNSQRRFNMICDNLDFLPKVLLSKNLPQLWDSPICFTEVIEDFEIYLNVNEYQPMEGFWALELRYKPSGQLVYLLTFGKLENALLISVIQGPNFEGSKELVKQLTKKCHGLRPAYLMVEAMKALTQVLGYSKLFGIPQKYQNKSRFVQSTRYFVDYDTIFKESNGELKEYWELPLTLESKNLEDIPSNKRSMYRKRYTMLNHLLRAIASKLKSELDVVV
ncbi:VirK/YbjX family protein [Glaesserella parasuis]|uniref:VirK/YbjX family protein n=1 Tax=Glaesserella parasuis TaxID=738 RepID=UPI0024363FCB|nr:VirK/YbjX family protein [Glaesserella parasuis]MDG6272764.1 VirK/YbjX family protein [Glaesserella parasuis]